MHTFEQICEGCIHAYFAPMPGHEDQTEFLGCRDLAEAAVDLEDGHCAHKETDEGGAP